ncbi:uncharacterized protein TNIN_267281 [Trichonephila inaurata madagascariensis]|uniref:Uncharacterized protein n=1 Tax=Trichonephila inaurata madagascariensis TaxID=2747483 RepID=A0A8X6JXG2_9ARAC|nr:uncharacterized protein TNIN_267281 [Trichonephila inaurata madagascariensis]
MIAQKAYDYGFKNIIWSYKAFQDNSISQKGIKFVEGLPEKFESDCLYIFDDFLQSLDEKVSQLFTITAHRSRISVILILQNQFPRNQVMRDISLRMHSIKYCLKTTVMLDKYNALPDNSTETKQHRLWMPTKRARKVILTICWWIYTRERTSGRKISAQRKRVP